MPKTKKATTKSVNKSAFIRSQPATLSAADVVKKGKAEGIKLSIAQVYTARANARRQAAKTAAPAKAKPGRKPGAQVAKAPPAAGGSHETHFMALVLDLGLSKTEALLERVRTKLKSSLLG
jgi:hypothetical protein